MSTLRHSDMVVRRIKGAAKRFVIDLKTSLKAASIQLAMTSRHLVHFDRQGESRLIEESRRCGHFEDKNPVYDD